MGAINFYIPNDLVNELMKIENRSSLITELLRDYFNKGKQLKELKEEKIKQAESLNKEVDILENEIKEEEKKKEENLKLMSEEETKEADEKQQRRKENLLKMKRETFNNFEIDKEKIEQLFNEFLEEEKKNPGLRIIEFMQSKEIKRKERR
ncbi:MAG: hypothetical protein M0R35_07130 [Candidatus Omnitrophica bacterium]|jgi:hypothetical protein|nr:hypothetical protein [Candidatus Omnitrophota bacterium]